MPGTPGTPIFRQGLKTPRHPIRRRKGYPTVKEDQSVSTASQPDVDPTTAERRLPVGSNKCRCGKCRRYFAGVSPKTLAARLGHSSVSVTFDLYAHALVEDQRDAAEAFAARLDATA
jgi:integrase